MNAGVEILLKRMDSHPEEFRGLDSHIKSLAPNVNENRWRWVLAAALEGKFLTDEEKTMLHDKLSSIQGEAFTAAVMRELMEDHKRVATGGSGMQAYLRAMEATRAAGVGNAGLSQLMGGAIQDPREGVIARILGK